MVLRSEAPTIERLFKKYKGKVQFYIVYIKEAHPSDGNQSRGNRRGGISVKQPKSEKERIGVASKCVKSLKLTLPCLIDGMDNKVNSAYSGWPDRLFVVGHDGKIAFSGEKGPWGFNTETWEAGIKQAIKKAPKGTIKAKLKKIADKKKKAAKAKSKGDNEKDDDSSKK